MGAKFVMWANLLGVLWASSMVGVWLIGNKTISLEVKVVDLSAESLDVVMVLDVVSMTFISLVFFISACVFFYSVSYMGKEEMSGRLMGLMVVFVFSMVLLIMFPSLMGVIIGWDGLGLSSFLLVVFYQNDLALASGMITALTNRIGDGLLVVAMGMCISSGHWWSYYEMGSLLGVTIGLASLTKSAQIPFCAWLPAAMAAPTPVSALVHSSTLVTAGVYLLLRYGAVKELADVLIGVGSMTMIMGGVSALYEEDVKKVVALSTLSQLGMMVFLVGLGFDTLCLFHLYMHALMKAGLFLGVGAMIHARCEQSITGMRGGVIDSPGTSKMIVAACGSLMGVPFLCGWFSKDMILEVLLSNVSWLYCFILLVGAISSVVYSGRLVRMCVFPPIGFGVMSRSADCGVMLCSMWFLLLSLMFGGPFFFYWLGMEIAVPVTEVDKAMGMVIIVLGVQFVSNWFVPKDFWPGWSDFSNARKSFWLDFRGMMWFLPLLSGELGMKALLLSNLSFRRLEQGWMEFFGGKGVMELGKVFLSFHSRSQSGGFNMTMKLSGIYFFILMVGGWLNVMM
uniref:NADH-ubiquinone oxidoreductase chain 5 n=1 Tax=Anadara antiquata TaxID=142560 RepID=A0A516IDG4_9BIVA|nr:NADH dehydrogenase subunit 5 [Anadara antiquata]